MKRLLAALLASAALAPLAPAHAQEKQTSAEQKRQQARMKNCNEKASSQGLKGDERQQFMSRCLKGEDGTTAQQQQKMSACNKQATARQLKGDDRKKFMSDCLKG